ncbi:hypothetical protein [Methanogenium cariaci]|uniref:hypothetical protein n=1 Tax=Methanogenium cariaci TaxID=2197 RepID=UPI000780AF6D|nr:hypothetical protein [Methanogenium cariaci]
MDVSSDNWVKGGIFFAGLVVVVPAFRFSTTEFRSVFRVVGTESPIRSIDSESHVLLNCAPPEKRIPPTEARSGQISVETTHTSSENIPQ